MALNLGYAYGVRERKSNEQAMQQMRQAKLGLATIQKRQLVFSRAKDNLYKNLWQLHCDSIRSQMRRI